MVKKLMLVLQDPQVSSISSTRPYSDFFNQFLCHPRTPIRIICVFDEQTDIPNSVFFPIKVPVKLPRIVFPHNSPANGCPYEFRSTTGSSMLAHDFGRLCRCECFIIKCAFLEILRRLSNNSFHMQSSIRFTHPSSAVRALHRQACSALIKQRAPPPLSAPSRQLTQAFPFCRGGATGRLPAPPEIHNAFGCLPVLS